MEENIYEKFGIKKPNWIKRFWWRILFSYQEWYCKVIPEKIRTFIRIRRMLTLLRAFGYKPIEIGYHIEWVFVFEKEIEAIKAYKFFETDHNLLVGWWYGKTDFENEKREWNYYHLYWRRRDKNKPNTVAVKLLRK